MNVASFLVIKRTSSVSPPAAPQFTDVLVRTHSQCLLHRDRSCSNCWAQHAMPASCCFRLYFWGITLQLLRLLATRYVFSSLGCTTISRCTVCSGASDFECTPTFARILDASCLMLRRQAPYESCPLLSFISWCVGAFAGDRFGQVILEKQHDAKPRTHVKNPFCPCVRIPIATPFCCFAALSKQLL